MALRLSEPAPTTGLVARLRNISPFTAIVAVLVVIVILAIAVPVLRMVQSAVLPDGAFDPDLFVRTFQTPGLGRAVLNTLIIAVVSLVVAVPVATLFAWLTERTDARMGVLSTLLPVIPLLMPIVALSIGWFFLANPRSGFIGGAIEGIATLFGADASELQIGISGWAGLLFVYIIVIIPEVYIVVAAAYRSIDPNLEEAARTSGSSMLRVFFTVSFPAVRHAVAAGALLGLITSVSLYSVPKVLGTDENITVLSTHIYSLINGTYPPKLDEAVVLGVLMVLVILSVWTLQRRYTARSRHAQISGMGIRANRLPLGRWKWPARIGLLVYIVCTSILPLAALVVVSLQNYWQPIVDPADFTLDNFAKFLADPLSMASLRNSVLLAVGTAMIGVLLAGVLAIYGFLNPGRLARTVGVVTKLPASMPHLAFAVAVLVTFGGAPFFLMGTPWILLLCYVIVFLPTMSIAAESAVSQVGKQLADASLMSGAGPARTLGRVVLPLSSSGLAAGWALVFTVIIGELNSAAILAGPTNPVVGYRIISIFEAGTYSQLASLGVLIVLISMVSTFTVLILARPRFTSRGSGRKSRPRTAPPTEAVLAQAAHVGGT